VKGNADLPRIIWVLWNQGWDNAPLVARATLKSWIRLNPAWDVRAVDQTRLADYLPADVLDSIYGTRKEQESMANLVRLELLWRHGGVWVDATAMCVRALDEWLTSVLTQGFFAFANPGPDRMLSTWFLAAEPANRLVGTWRVAMKAYWHGRDARHTYFYMHELFAICYANDPQFKAIWDSTTRISANHPFHFSPDSPALLGPPGSDLSKIMASPPAPVFKLTHKFTTPPPKGSLFYKLCEIANLD
jgi:hypothetical protein